MSRPTDATNRLKRPALSKASPEPAMAESAKPVELVQFDAASGKFSLGADALRALRAVRTPVAVVAVCGRARQGKSFILNQLLGRSRGFQVAPTHRPCTKGLWMWSAPVPRTAPDGSPYHLVLLDTEGIDAYDQTGQYSTQIFSLAVLLSSLFVYNQMGGIDEAALDRLSLVTEMTQHIRARSSEGPATGAELGRFAPSFLWLLRDFYLELEEDGRRIAPRDYLEAALRAVPGSGAAAASKNRIRESIKDLFPDRDCFTLVRPVNDERDLAHLDSLDPARLRSEFRQGLDRLTQTVFERARPKELGATVITGPMLAGLAEAYVGAINAGAVPTIQTAWQGVAEAECRRAADAALAAFAAALDLSATSGEEGAMREAYERAVEAAVAAFAEGAVGDAGVRAAHERRLRADLRARFDAERDREVHRAAEREREAADRARAVVAAAAHAPGATSAAVLRAALEAAGVFPTGARGAEAALRFLIRDVLPGDVARACERQDTELGKARDRLKTLEGAAEELREARTRVRELEAELAGARDRMKTLEGATEELREARARTRELETEVARVRGERDGLERAKEEVRREYQAQMERQRQEHERAMMHAREKAHAERQQLEGQVMDMKDRSSRVQAEEARARQELERARDTERAARQAGRVAQEEAAEAKERVRALAEREAAALGEVKAAEERIRAADRARHDAEASRLEVQLQKDNEVRERMKLETELRELRAQLAAAKDEAREAQEAQREAKRPRTEGRKRERSPGNDARRGSLLGGLFGAGWGSGAPTAAAPEPAEDGPDEAEADSEDAETEGDGPEGDSAALRGTDPESLTIPNIKDMLMRAGFVSVVAEGNREKWKKPQWVAEFRRRAARA